MAAELPRGAPRAGAASFNSLPPDVLGLIGERLLEDGPLWDRGDCLQLACNLAAVGNEATTLLAGSLFSILSPRLGEGRQIAPPPPSPLRRKATPAGRPPLRSTTHHICTPSCRCRSGASQWCDRGQ